MNFKNLKKVGDIEYYDGPMLSLFINKMTGYLYLYSWIDVLPNENSHVWLVYQINAKHLQSYMNREIDEKTLMEYAINRVYYLVRISSELKYTSPKKLSYEDLDKQDLIPEKEIMFENYYCKEFSHIQDFLSKQISYSTNILYSDMVLVKRLSPKEIDKHWENKLSDSCNISSVFNQKDRKVSALCE